MLLFIKNFFKSDRGNLICFFIFIAFCAVVLESIYSNESSRLFFIYIWLIVGSTGSCISAILASKSNRDTKKLIAAIDEATDEIRYLRKTINVMTQRGNTKPVAK